MNVQADKLVGDLIKKCIPMFIGPFVPSNNIQLIVTRELLYGGHSSKNKTFGVWENTCFRKLVFCKTYHKNEQKKEIMTKIFKNNK